jgi:hypothetical protein
MITASPFLIALRLDARVLRDSELPAGGIESLPPVATIERSSAHFEPDTLPAPGEADTILRTSFLEHPLVNTSRQPGQDPPQLAPPEVFITAQIVVQPALEPIPPGGEFPSVDDEVLSDIVLVHRASVARDAIWDEDEAAAAHILLARIAQPLKADLWNPGS